MRTVTGVVGRVNRANYRIATPTATVGIRGTGGIISVIDAITRVFGTSGIWTLANAAGTLDVLPGRVGIATTDTSSPPQQGAGEQPVTPPVAVSTVNYNPNEDRTATGTPEVLQGDSRVVKTVTDASLYGVIVQEGVAVLLPFPAFSGVATTGAGFDADGNLRTFTFTSSTSNPFRFDFFQATPLDRGGNEDVSIARLIRTLSLTEIHAGVPETESLPFASNRGFHYVVGQPTQVMPTSGYFTYNFAFATSPTLAFGSTAPGVVTSGTGSVYFGGVSAAPHANFSWQTSLGGVTYNTSISGSISGNLVSATGSTSGGSGSICTTSCSTQAYIGFFGPDARTAAGSYVTHGSGNSFGGAIGFTKGAASGGS